MSLNPVALEERLSSLATQYRQLDTGSKKGLSKTAPSVKNTLDTLSNVISKLHMLIMNPLLLINYVPQLKSVL